MILFIKLMEHIKGVLEKMDVFPIIQRVLHYLFFSPAFCFSNEFQVTMTIFLSLSFFLKCVSGINEKNSTVYRHCLNLNLLELSRVCRVHSTPLSLSLSRHREITMLPCAVFTHSVHKEVVGLMAKKRAKH